MSHEISALQHPVHVTLLYSGTSGTTQVPSRYPPGTPQVPPRYPPGTPQVPPRYPPGTIHMLLKRPRLLWPLWSCGCRVRIPRGPCSLALLLKGVGEPLVDCSALHPAQPAAGPRSPSPLHLQCPIFPLTPPELRCSHPAGPFSVQMETGRPHGSARAWGLGPGASCSGFQSSLGVSDLSLQGPNCQHFRLARISQRE